MTAKMILGKGVTESLNWCIIILFVVGDDLIGS
jgi:hypothetical protein